MSGIYLNRENLWIYLMNIEIWNLGNYISLKEIDCIVEQRKEKEDHPMEKLLEKLKK